MMTFFMRIFVLIIINGTSQLAARTYNSLEEIQKIIECEFNENTTCPNESDDFQARFSFQPVILLWPNGEIHFRVDQNLSKAHKSAIAEAINHWEENTCLKFINHSANENFNISMDHIYFTGFFKGCYSEIGKFGGKQNLNLGPGCAKVEVVIHEIGHSIGLIHEQSRTDRDDYVLVLEDNVLDNYKHNFRKGQHTRGVEYDYTSVMHYDYNAFSKNVHKFNTFLSKDPHYQYLMGSGKRLSFSDRKWVNTLYKCSDRCSDGFKNCSNGGFLNQQCKCLCPDGMRGVVCEEGEISKAPVCSQEVLEPGVISTPNYPRRSSEWENRSCVYRIKAPQNKIVKATFIDFKFFGKFEDHCSFEHVEIRLNGVLSQGEFFCGYELQNRTLISLHNEMVILINSYLGPQVYGRGFKMQIDFVDGLEQNSQVFSNNSVRSVIGNKSNNVSKLEEIDTEIEEIENEITDCTIGGIISPKVLNSSQQLIFRSKGSQYTNNELCGLQLKTNDNNFLMIEVMKLNIEEAEECLHDSLDILDGNHNILKSYCGSTIPPPFLTNKKNIIILFTSDNNKTGSGFELKLRAIDPGNHKNSIYCNGNEVVQLGFQESIEIKSSNFDANLVESNNSCDIKVQAENLNSALEYQITHITTKQEVDCDETNLQLIDSENNRIIRFCGNFTAYHDIISKGSIELHFTSNSSYPEKFQIKFQEVPIYR